MWFDWDNSTTVNNLSNSTPFGHFKTEHIHFCVPTGNNEIQLQISGFSPTVAQSNGTGKTSKQNNILKQGPKVNS